MAELLPFQASNSMFARLVVQHFENRRNKSLVRHLNSRTNQMETKSRNENAYPDCVAVLR